MSDPTALIRRQLSGYPLDYIRSEARRRIDRLREIDGPVVASVTEAHIAGHEPADEAAERSPCVKCDQQWPCPAITAPWGALGYR